MNFRTTKIQAYIYLVNELLISKLCESTVKLNVFCTVGFVEALPAAPEHITIGKIRSDVMPHHTTIRVLSRSRQTALRSYTTKKTEATQKPHSELASVF